MKESTKKKIIVTIPAYNEEKTIGNVIKKIKEVMQKNRYTFEIIVVNDGSKDRTKEIAEKEGAIVYSHPINYGLAETFRTELQKCIERKADIILHVDADDQYRAEDMPTLIRQIEIGYDLVLGSRFKGKIEEMPLIKRWGNRAFSRVVSNITNTKISDAQTGFRAFTRELAERVPISSTHTYTQEQIIRAVKERYKVIEVPIYFAKRGKKTKSRLMKNSLEYAMKAWINIFRVYRDYQPIKFFGYMSLIFFIPGFLLGLYLVYNFLTKGIVGRLPSAMLVVLLISISVQIALNGFIADMLSDR